MTTRNRERRKRIIEDKKRKFRRSTTSRKNSKNCGQSIQSGQSPETAIKLQKQMQKNENDGRNAATQETESYVSLCQNLEFFAAATAQRAGPERHNKKWPPPTLRTQIYGGRSARKRPGSGPGWIFLPRQQAGLGLREYFFYFKQTWSLYHPYTPAQYRQGGTQETLVDSEQRLNWRPCPSCTKIK